MKRQIEAFCSKRMMLLAIGIFFLSVIFSITDVTIASEKPDIIRIGFLLDLTGPYASGGAAQAGANEDVWKYISTELGDVRGVKVETITRDIAGKMPLALSMYNELINLKPKPMFLFIGQSTVAAALRERLNEDGIIGFAPSSPDCLYPAGNTFGIFPLYEEKVAIGIKYIKDNWKENRNLRIGIITWDSTYGRAILTDEFFGYLKSIGVDIVGTELFGVRDVDVTSQLMRLREKKADWLVTNCAAGGPVTIKKGCKDMGWEINMINSFGSDWSTVRLAPHVFNGDICVMNVRSYDEVDHPSIKKVMKYFNESKRSKMDTSVLYLMSWLTQPIKYAAMVSVVDKYKWEGFNTGNLVKVLQSLRDFHPVEGLSEVTYSEKRRTPTKARVYKIENGKLLPVTADFVEVPDLRSAKYK